MNGSLETHLRHTTQLHPRGSWFDRFESGLCSLQFLLLCPSVHDDAIACVCTGLWEARIQGSSERMCLVAMSLTRLCSRLSLRSLLVQRRSWAKEGLGRPPLRTEATAPAVVERSEPFEDTSEFVRTRPGLRAKIIDGRALAKKVCSLHARIYN